MDDVQNIRAGPGGGMDPDMMTPQQLHDTLWKVLSFRDNVSKKIENTLEKIPGLVSSASISVDQNAILINEVRRFCRGRLSRRSPTTLAFSSLPLWSLVSGAKAPTELFTDPGSLTRHEAYYQECDYWSSSRKRRGHLLA
jgi:hypothetical protein